LVKTTIYTVAEFKGYPFLDPHWIKKANGQSEVGPNAVPVPSPETYSGYFGDVTTSLSKLKEIVTGNALKLLTDPEFLSLVSKEWLSSISKNAMIKRVQKFIPKIRPEHFSRRGIAGIRSPVITPKGKFLTDVMELEDKNSYHIINYNSPGATGAPAYSAIIVKKLQERGFLDYTIKPKKSIWDFDIITI
jgi:L-2-hydroxyglutarate oxidase